MYLPFTCSVPEYLYFIMENFLRFLRCTVSRKKLIKNNIKIKILFPIFKWFRSYNVICRYLNILHSHEYFFHFFLAGNIVDGLSTKTYQRTLLEMIFVNFSPTKVSTLKKQLLEIPQLWCHWKKLMTYWIFWLATQNLAM